MADQGTDIKLGRRGKKVSISVDPRGVLEEQYCKMQVERELGLEGLAQLIHALGNGDAESAEALTERIPGLSVIHRADGLLNLNYQVPDGEDLPAEEVVAYTEQELLRQGIGGQRVVPPRPGRNEPCPCGSGKKFKRCCIDPTSQRAA